jgi:hypothetical protein
MYATKNIPSLKKSLGTFVIALIMIIIALMGIGFAARTLAPSFEGPVNALIIVSLFQIPVDFEKTSAPKISVFRSGFLRTAR